MFRPSQPHCQPHAGIQAHVCPISSASSVALNSPVASASEPISPKPALLDSSNHTGPMTFPQDLAKFLMQGRRSGSLPMTALKGALNTEKLFHLSATSEGNFIHVKQNACLLRPPPSLPLLICVYKGVIQIGSLLIAENRYAVHANSTQSVTFTPLCDSIVLFFPILSLNLILPWAQYLRQLNLKDSEKYKLEHGGWSNCVTSCESNGPGCSTPRKGASIQAKWKRFASSCTRQSLIDFQKMCMSKLQPRRLPWKNLSEEKKSLSSNKRKDTEAEDDEDEEEDSETVDAMLSLKNHVKKSRRTERSEWRRLVIPWYSKENRAEIGKSHVNLVYFFHHLASPIAKRTLGTR